MEIYGKLGPHIPKWQWNYPSCRQWGWTMSASPLIPLLWGFWKLHTNDAQLRYWRTCFRESSKIEILCKIISTKFFCFFLMKMTSSVTQPLLLQTTLLGAEQRKPHEAYFQAVACLFRLPQLVSARAEFDATCWRRLVVSKMNHSSIQTDDYRGSLYLCIYLLVLVFSIRPGNIKCFKSSNENRTRNGFPK